jgi:hypothetical protein
MQSISHAAAARCAVLGEQKNYFIRLELRSPDFDLSGDAAPSGDLSV